MAEAPAARGVLFEKHIPEIGVTEWKLKNGLKVILKSTDFQNDQILFSAFSPGGSSLFADDDLPSGVWGSQILAGSGLGAFKAAELEKKLTGKVARARAAIGELGEGLQGDASPQDLETLMQLIYLQFTAPRPGPVPTARRGGRPRSGTGCRPTGKLVRKSAGIDTRNRPVGLSWRCSARAKAPSTSVASARACSSTPWPKSVRCSRRVVRCKSFSPNRVSSAASRRETLDFGRPRRSAARLKLPASMTRANSSRSSASRLMGG